MRIFKATVRKANGKISYFRYVRLQDLPYEFMKNNVGVEKFDAQVHAGILQAQDRPMKTAEYWKNLSEIRDKIPKPRFGRELVWDVEKSGWRYLVYDRIIDGPEYECNIFMAGAEADVFMGWPRDKFNARIERYISYVKASPKYVSKFELLQERKSRYWEKFGKFILEQRCGHRKRLTTTRRCNTLDIEMEISRRNNNGN